MGATESIIKMAEDNNGMVTTMVESSQKQTGGNEIVTAPDRWYNDILEKSNVKSVRDNIT